jgi:hypothetical protein
MLYSTPLCVLKTIVPVDILQVGWTTDWTDGRAGGAGTALIVTVEAAVAVQVLSAVLLTDKVNVPGRSPAKVEPDWYAAPTLYSTPGWVLKTMVPEGVPQVGCIMVSTVGADGAAGMALTDRERLAPDRQVGDAASRAVTV